MPVCPDGHTSTADDYCDVCGTPITAVPAESRCGVCGAPATGTPCESCRAAPSAGGPAADSQPAACPDCATPRTGRFCEECGYDFELGSPGARPTPARGWSAIIDADRDYYEAVAAQDGPDAVSIDFPPYCPQRRVALSGQQMRIGRHSASRGSTPEIDLSRPPEDPGVSHEHAVLLARPGETWVLVDPGSTNGTTVNGGTEPITVNVEVPLHDGDRIHVGAWTTITLQRDEPA